MHRQPDPRAPSDIAAAGDGVSAVWLVAAVVLVVLGVLFAGGLCRCAARGDVEAPCREMNVGDLPQPRGSERGVITVEFTEREARALANVADLMRGVLRDDRDRFLEIPPGAAPLETAHLKLIAAVERGELVAL
jgi:hypothetical protein